MNLVEKLMHKWFARHEEDRFEHFSPVDYKFIANKIIEEVKSRPNYNYYPFTCARLSKLVLLTDIKFRQKYNKPLIKNEYQCYDINGVILNDVYDYYTMENNGEIHMDDWVQFSQKDYEQWIGKTISKGIDKLVKEIVTMTEFVDVSTLRELTEKFPINERGFYATIDEKWRGEHAYTDKIPHETISKWYKLFDFNKAIEINKENKAKLSASKQLIG